MGKILAFIQASTDPQDVENQHHAIVAYARRASIPVDSFIQIAGSGPKNSRKRRIDELKRELRSGDLLLVFELSRLGRSVGEVITLIDQLLNLGVSIKLLKEDLLLAKDQQSPVNKDVVSLFAKLAEMEREFSSLRTKKALAAKKAEGVTLGKPRGTIQASIYDKDRERIQELLRLGVSQRRIVTTHLGYGTSNSLRHYIRTRGLQPGLSRDEAITPQV